MSIRWGGKVRIRKAEMKSLSKKINTSFFQHLITLIKNKMFHLVQLQRPFFAKSHNTTGSPNNDMWGILLHLLPLRLNRNTSINFINRNPRKILPQSLKFPRNLVCQFMSMTQHNSSGLGRLLRVKLLENRKNKNACFPHSGFCLANEILSEHCLGDCLVLH